MYCNMIEYDWPRKWILGGITLEQKKKIVIVAFMYACFEYLKNCCVYHLGTLFFFFGRAVSKVQCSLIMQEMFRVPGKFFT